MKSKTVYMVASLRASAIILFLFSAAETCADVVLAPLFRDNTVLQRDKPVPVRGRADPGEQITVRFRAQEKQATANKLGHWMVVLDKMPASSVPASLVATGKNTVTVRNVLVGDVWLCAGQSNMAWTIASTTGAKELSAGADFPLVRQFKVPLVSSSLPCDDAGGSWVVCSPDTAGIFSTVAYSFARELYQKLKIPIGIINCSWSGTIIEAWMSPAALTRDPSWPAILKRWQDNLSAYPKNMDVYQKNIAPWIKEYQQARKEGRTFTKTKPRLPEGYGSRSQPGAIHNGLVMPLLPAAICGAIWYQGESNASRYLEYRTLFPAMIRQWREDFLSGDFPFYYVQLPNWKSGAAWEFLREAQDYALKLPAVECAVTIDIGDPDDLHPQNKIEVGQRLALIALAKDYGFGVAYAGPVFDGFAKEGDKLRLKFKNAAGLMTKDPAMPGFVIAGADRNFVPATAKIEGESIVVYASGVPEPIAARYAWAPAPPAPVYNAAGLPARPFRTDDWSK